MRRWYGSHIQSTYAEEEDRISHARSYQKKAKYNIVNNHSSCLKAKIKITENKPNKKCCKVYTRVYCVWKVKTILITFEMLFNPLPFSGGSVQCPYIYTYNVDPSSTQAQTLGLPGSWLKSLSSKLFVGISHPDHEADGSPGTALGECWGSFFEYVTGVSPASVLLVFVEAAPF